MILGALCSSVATATQHRRIFTRNILRKAFLEDWLLKLIALAITLGLWFAVTGLSTPTRERLSVPLNLIIASNAQITNSPQHDVQIEISGDKRKIDQINRGDLSATYDLTDVAPGDWVITLAPERLSVPLPQGVRVEEIVPGRIPVKIEALAERELEVNPQTIGEVVSGYEVYQTTVLPPRVRVRGPASIVNALENVITDKIDLAGRREDFTARQVQVNSPNQAAILNTVVDVFFRIGEKRIERSITVPVTGMPGRYVSFAIFGPRSQVQRARSEDFVAALKMSGSGDLTPTIVTPPELVDSVEVRRVTLRP